MTVRVICANTQREIKSRTSSEQFSYSNFVIYGGKASVFSPCVDAIHLTSCLKIQIKYPIKISERKVGGNKNTNQKRPN